MRRSRNRRQVIWWVLSAAIVLSMVCSLTIFIEPPQPPRPTATPPLRPTAIAAPPTATPLPPTAAPSATNTLPAS